MDIEFHYHITCILARRGGFAREDAAAIAQACQYTDDNNDKYRVRLNDGRVYENYISQTLDIRYPKNRLVRIYTCFHFLPGDPDAEAARRADGAMHLFNTTAGAPAARRALQTALDSGDVHRIGIAAHALADTWAHQNFVGFEHAFNDGRGLLARLTPTIGHADFQHRPDLPTLVWSDHRLLHDSRRISNKDRFMLAAGALFTAFAAHNGLDDVEGRWAALAGDLGRAIGTPHPGARRCVRGRRARLAAYRTLCPDLPPYDDRRWLRQAASPLARWPRRLGDRLWRLASRWPLVGGLLKAYWPTWGRVRTFRATDAFEGSHWHRFQDAVKCHQAFVMEQLKPLYEQIGAAVRRRL
ncbi:MAG: hypothetical protein GX591_01470 [Planctomycetes bacterium]|nr:hypothetical protein [Planctomycetota bacterium]